MSSIQLVMYSNYLILMDSVLGMWFVRMVKNGYITVKTNPYVFLIKKAENEILNQILKKGIHIKGFATINALSCGTLVGRLLHLCIPTQRAFAEHVLDGFSVSVVLSKVRYRSLRILLRKSISLSGLFHFVCFKMFRFLVSLSIPPPLVMYLFSCSDFIS